MALTESGTTDFTDPSDDNEVAASPSSVKLTDNKAILVYNSVKDASNTDQGRILDISGGSLSMGAAREIAADPVGSSVDVDRISSTKAILAFRDSNDGSKGKLKTLSVSGTNITPNSVATFQTNAIRGEQMVTALVSASLGLVAHRRTTNAHLLCRYTISGDTVSPGIPAAHTDSSTGLPLALVALDSTKLLYMYRGPGTSISCQVLDITSGITQGTSSAIPGVTDGSPVAGKGAAKLTSTKAVVVFKQAGTPTKISAVVVNTSGNTIDSFGAIFDLVSDNDADQIYVATINSTQVLVIYNDGTNQGIIETLNISGSTITRENDAVTLTVGNEARGSVPVVISTKAIASWVAGTRGYSAMISGVPEGGGGGSDPAQFYSGIGTLDLKFTLPFSGVAPKAMTLDKPLGTVVIGSKVAAGVPIVFSDSPYPTGTATFDGFPTGTSISAVRWI